MTETMDADITEEPGTDLAYRHEATPTLFGTDNPRLIIAKASGVADALKDVIVKQRMALRIGQSEYIKVEGWTTLGALLGVFPKVEWTRELTDGEGASQGWEAAVVVVNGAGVEIGRAEAQCLRAERNWKNRDDFALRSMAQTRAMGKALRMPLGWIAVMAGYDATPAEEMPEVVPTQSDDVPFDDTGAQGPRDGEKSPTAVGSDTGTGASTTRKEALEQRRVELTARLLEFSDRKGKREAGEKAIADNRAAARAAKHLVWLEDQIAQANQRTAA